MAMGGQCVLMVQVSPIIRQGKNIHVMVRRHGPYLMEGADFVALVGRIRNTVAEVKNFHNFLKIGRRGRI